MVEIKLPNEAMMKRKTPSQQVRLVVNSINDYDKSLYKELREVAKLKAEIAMILVSDKDWRENNENLHCKSTTRRI